MVQIECVELVVTDLAAALRFYVEALGFEATGTVQRTAGKMATLQLGGTRLNLIAFDDAGAPYPSPRAANDPWFQHFAVAVSDMPAAYAQLSRYPHEPISTGGPQLLPPSTGSVTAYKFRDPDGHPLELSFNPAAAGAGAAGTAGGATSTAGPFIGIDHSAIAVAELEPSIAFYTGLGFQVAERLVNTGPEQDRLDGLSGVVVDIIVLKGEAGPHLELLHYRRPLPAAAVAVAPGDVAATRLLLSGAGDGGSRRDPDGHLIEMAARAG